MMTGQDREPTVREGDLWAWSIGFVVTLGLHVGTALFTSLSILLFIYALPTSSGEVPMAPRAVLWLSVIISLTIWGVLVKQQIRGLRPHVIGGLGNFVVVTSGSEWGEIAADTGAGLIGLAQVVPLATLLLSGERVPNPVKVATALVGSLFVISGFGSLGLRLWLRRRRTVETDRSNDHHNLQS